MSKLFEPYRVTRVRAEGGGAATGPLLLTKIGSNGAGCWLLESCALPPAAAAGAWHRAGASAHLSSRRQVRLHTDKDTGRSKGFAHVHFAGAGAAGVLESRAAADWQPVVKSVSCIAHTLAAHMPRLSWSADEAGLDGAMALDGTTLLGRRIRVGYAQPKKEGS